MREDIARELTGLLDEWLPILKDLEGPVITNLRNRQDRTIKQIAGHLIDSASNNLHRMIHLQYQPTPLIFPDYANLGANDRWIALQNYQEEEWDLLVQLLRCLNLHFIHVMNQIDSSAWENIWISALDQEITLRAMIADYPRHFRLHLDEIRELAERS